MAESGRIAAKLRGTFRRIVAGTGLRKVSTTVMALPATRVRPCATIAHFLPHLLLVTMQRLTSSTIDLGVKLVRQWTRFPD